MAVQHRAVHLLRSMCDKAETYTLISVQALMVMGALGSHSCFRVMAKPQLLMTVRLLPKFLRLMLAVSQCITACHLARDATSAYPLWLCGLAWLWQSYIYRLQPLRLHVSITCVEWALVAAAKILESLGDGSPVWPEVSLFFVCGGLLPALSLLQRERPPPPGALRSARSRLLPAKSGDASTAPYSAADFGGKAHANVTSPTAAQSSGVCGPHRGASTAATADDALLAGSSSEPDTPSRPGGGLLHPLLPLSPKSFSLSSSSSGTATTADGLSPDSAKHGSPALPPPSPFPPLSHDDHEVTSSNSADCCALVAQLLRKRAVPGRVAAVLAGALKDGLDAGRQRDQADRDVSSLLYRGVCTSLPISIKVLQDPDDFVGFAAQLRCSVAGSVQLSAPGMVQVHSAVVRGCVLLLGHVIHLAGMGVAHMARQRSAAAEGVDAADGALGPHARGDGAVGAAAEGELEASDLARGLLDCLPLQGDMMGSKVHVQVGGAHVTRELAPKRRARGPGRLEDSAAAMTAAVMDADHRDLGWLSPGFGGGAGSSRAGIGRVGSSEVSGDVNRDRFYKDFAAPATAGSIIGLLTKRSAPVPERPAVVATDMVYSGWRSLCRERPARQWMLSHGQIRQLRRQLPDELSSFGQTLDEVEPAGSASVWQQDSEDDSDSGEHESTDGVTEPSAGGAGGLKVPEVTVGGQTVGADDTPARSDAAPNSGSQAAECSAEVATAAAAAVAVTAQDVASGDAVRQAEPEPGRVPLPAQAACQAAEAAAEASPSGQLQCGAAAAAEKRQAAASEQQQPTQCQGQQLQREDTIARELAAQARSRAQASPFGALQGFDFDSTEAESSEFDNPQPPAAAAEAAAAVPSPRTDAPLASVGVPVPPTVVAPVPVAAPAAAATAAAAPSRQQQYSTEPYYNQLQESARLRAQASLFGPLNNEDCAALLQGESGQQQQPAARRQQRQQRHKQEQTHDRVMLQLQQQHAADGGVSVPTPAVPGRGEDGGAIALAAACVSGNSVNVAAGRMTALPPVQLELRQPPATDAGLPPAVAAQLQQQARRQAQASPFGQMQGFDDAEPTANAVLPDPIAQQLQQQARRQAQASPFGQMQGFDDDDAAADAVLPDPVADQLQQQARRNAQASPFGQMQGFNDAAPVAVAAQRDPIALQLQQQARRRAQASPFGQLQPFDDAEPTADAVLPDPITQQLQQQARRQAQASPFGQMQAFDDSAAVQPTVSADPVAQQLQRQAQRTAAASPFGHMQPFDDDDDDAVATAAGGTTSSTGATHTLLPVKAVESALTAQLRAQADATAAALPLVPGQLQLGAEDGALTPTASPFASQQQQQIQPPAGSSLGSSQAASPGARRLQEHRPLPLHVPVQAVSTPPTVGIPSARTALPLKFGGDSAKDMARPQAVLSPQARTPSAPAAPAEAPSSAATAGAAAAKGGKGPVSNVCILHPCILQVGQVGCVNVHISAAFETEYRLVLYQTDGVVVHDHCGSCGAGTHVVKVHVPVVSSVDIVHVALVIPAERPVLMPLGPLPVLTPAAAGEVQKLWGKLVAYCQTTMTAAAAASAREGGAAVDPAAIQAEAVCHAWQDHMRPLMVDLTFLISCKSPSAQQQPDPAELHNLACHVITFLWQNQMLGCLQLLLSVLYPVPQAGAEGAYVQSSTDQRRSALSALALLASPSNSFALDGRSSMGGSMLQPPFDAASFGSPAGSSSGWPTMARGSVGGSGGQQLQPPSGGWLSSARSSVAQQQQQQQQQQQAGWRSMAVGSSGGGSQYTTDLRGSSSGGHTADGRPERTVANQVQAALMESTQRAARNVHAQVLLPAGLSAAGSNASRAGVHGGSMAAGTPAERSPRVAGAGSAPAAVAAVPSLADSHRPARLVPAFASSGGSSSSERLPGGAAAPEYFQPPASRGSDGGANPALAGSTSGGLFKLPPPPPTVTAAAVSSLVAATAAATGASAASVPLPPNMSHAASAASWVLNAAARHCSASSLQPVPQQPQQRRRTRKQPARSDDGGEASGSGSARPGTAVVPRVATAATGHAAGGTAGRSSRFNVWSMAPRQLLSLAVRGFRRAAVERQYVRQRSQQLEILDRVALILYTVMIYMSMTYHSQGQYSRSGSSSDNIGSSTQAGDAPLGVMAHGPQMLQLATTMLQLITLVPYLLLCIGGSFVRRFREHLLAAYQGGCVLWNLLLTLGVLSMPPGSFLHRMVLQDVAQLLVYGLLRPATLQLRLRIGVPWMAAELASVALLSWQFGSPVVQLLPRYLLTALLSATVALAAEIFARAAFIAAHYQGSTA